jgi:hypothetical protein
MAVPGEDILPDHLRMDTRMSRIADVLRQQSPDAELPEPSAEQPRKWLRFPCPFCGKDRAAINYALDLFVCHHDECRQRIWAREDSADPDNWLSDRFQFQLSQAVRNVQGKYGRWVKGENVKDLRQYGEMMLIEYERKGQLDSWEADVDGDPDQLDRYVLAALNGDLLNWMEKLVRSRRREALSADYQTQIRPTDESVEDTITWVAWPTLGLRFKWQLTVAEMARSLGISESTVKRRLRGEMAEAKRFYKGE